MIPNINKNIEWHYKVDTCFNNMLIMAFPNQPTNTFNERLNATSKQNNILITLNERLETTMT
jgi:hypothetical protein